MGKYRFLGVDPGIANTALAIVESTSAGGYRLLKSRLVKSTPREPESSRLLNIYNHTIGILNEFSVDAVFIEQVFFGKNLTSAMTTAKVIGVVSCASATNSARGGDKTMPIVEITPQEVKKTSGLGGASEKSAMVTAAQRIFRNPDIKSHHIADACFVGLAGLLRSKVQAK